MEMRNPDVQMPEAPAPSMEAAKQEPKDRAAVSTRAPSIIVGLVITVVAALSIWRSRSCKYLPDPSNFSKVARDCFRLRLLKLNDRAGLSRSRDGATA